MKITINVDGGARGNPGPGGCGILMRDEGATVLYEAGFFLGHVTNNQAEYTGLLRALKAARTLAPSDLQIYSDSELLVRQIRGEYRVKNEGLKVLYDQVMDELAAFKSWRVDHIRREFNKEADQLANAAMDARRDVIRTELLMGQ